MDRRKDGQMEGRMNKLLIYRTLPALARVCLYLPGAKSLYRTLITLYNFKCLIKQVFKTRHKIFHENPALSRTTSYEFLAPSQNLLKANDRIPRKCLDRKMDGRTE